MAFEDMFIQIYKDDQVELWEFDHEGWGSPPESARFRMRADQSGVAVLVAKPNPDVEAESDDLDWEVEGPILPSFDRAAAKILDRYFFQDCFRMTDEEIIFEHRYSR